MRAPIWWGNSVLFGVIGLTIFVKDLYGMDSMDSMNSMNSMVRMWWV